MDDIDNNSTVETSTDNQTDAGENDTGQRVQQVPESVQVVKYKPGGFKKGFDPNRNLKGRPHKIAQFEAMLNREHRNMEAVTALFARLRALALGELIAVPYSSPSGEIEYKIQLKSDPAFMKLYLDRILGLPRVYDDNFDLSDASPEVLEYLRRKVVGG